jgi:CRISPR-associated protein Cas1
MLKSLDDDSHVKTRLCQYEAYNGEKGITIAKQLVISKIKGQSILLEKYGLQPHDLEKINSKIEALDSSNPDSFRKKLTGIEGKFTEHYFKHILQLIPEELRPEKRKKYKAYDGINNILNLAYEVLSWKVHRALIKAKLEPYLGFLHSVQFGKPSLICDMQELYRYLIDDFVIQFSQTLRKKDFIIKTESVSKKRLGKREYINDKQTRRMMKELQDYMESMIEVPLIRHGKRQRLETLINEEALLLAKYLRNEIDYWIPRLVNIS